MIKAKCTNSNKNHTVIWKEFSAYKKVIKRAHTKQVTIIQRIQQKLVKSVTANVSYTQILRNNRMTPQKSKQQLKKDDNWDPVIFYLR